MTEAILSRNAAWEARLAEIETDIDWHHREIVRHQNRIADLNQRFSRICEQGPP
jgi:chromosome segregation ATPase